MSLEGRGKHCFLLIMFGFCGSNAPYSANASFRLFIFLSIPFDTRDFYYFGSSLSLVLLTSLTYILKTEKRGIAIFGGLSTEAPFYGQPFANYELPARYLLTMKKLLPISRPVSFFPCLLVLELSRSQKIWSIFQ